MVPPHQLLLFLTLLASPFSRPAAAADGVAGQPPPLVQQFYYYSPPPPSSPPLTAPPPPPPPACNCEKTPTPPACNCEKTPPPGIRNYRPPAGQLGFLSGSHVHTGGQLHCQMLLSAVAAAFLVWWY